MKKKFRPISEYSPGALLALAMLFVQLAVNLFAGYGYFRDEFYYIACADHLAWGYIDHPPLSIFILWVNRMLLGDSVVALRFLPAVAAAALVYLTGLVARAMGGGKTAQFVASLAVGFAPVYLAVGSFYSMNVFEPLFWVGAAYVLIRILNTGNQRLWLLFGAVAGLGLLNKHSMLFFGFALVVALAATLQRKQFASKWFWGSGAVAAILFLPNLLWQATHDWATLEFMQNAQQWKNAPMSPLDFLSAQILFQHPIAFPLWLAGLAAFFFHEHLKKYRIFGIAYLVLLGLFIVQRGKPYYLSPVYPLLLGAGAILVEQYFHRMNWKLVTRGYVVLLSAGGLATLPLWMPVLPVETYVSYSRLLGLQPPKMERHQDTVLPQVFADRFGWKELVADVASAYHSLTPEEQSRAAIYTQNYGEAGAIDFFGGQHHLPKAVSGHNNYWFWGMYDSAATIMIIVGGSREDHNAVFDSVVLAATHRHKYAMPYETELPIYICKKPKIPLKDVWPSVRHYI